MGKWRLLMKEIMRQYGAAVISAVITLLLISLIVKLPIGGTDGIGNKLLQGTSLSVQEGSSAMEAYWRAK
jgi:hypothetical protein